MNERAERDAQQSQARKAAYDRFLNQSHVDPMGEAFESGWESAMRYVGLLVQTPGGDGCYCVHHPDDPAHTADCYDLIAALTGK